MGKIVPLYAADQGIVDTLCHLIRELDDNTDLSREELEEIFTPKQLEIFWRIVK